MMEKSTLAFVNRYKKDEVYDGDKHTVCFSLNYLIDKNVFAPDNEEDNTMTDTLNGGTLGGWLVATYDNSTFEVKVSYETTNLCNEPDDKTYEGV